METLDDYQSKPDMFIMIFEMTERQILSYKILQEPLEIQTLF